MHYGEEYGDVDKKIWLREYGAPTGGSGKEADDFDFTPPSSP